MTYRDFLKSLMGKECDLRYADGSTPCCELEFFSNAGYKNHKIVMVEDDFVIIQYARNKYANKYIFPIGLVSIKIVESE